MASSSADQNGGTIRALALNGEQQSTEEEENGSNGNNNKYKKTIVLQSVDGHQFEADYQIIQLSVTLRDMAKACSSGEEKENAVANTRGQQTKEGMPPISTTNVLVVPILVANEFATAPMLAKVLVWCDYHKYDPPVDEASHVLLPWDSEFVKPLDKSTIFRMMMVANYLQLEGLLCVLAKTVARMIDNKTVEQIRAEFNIENDFGPGEEDAIREENAWCEEKEKENPTNK